MEVNPADKRLNANKEVVATSGIVYPQLFGDVDVHNITKNLL